MNSMYLIERVSHRANYSSRNKQAGNAVVELPFVLWVMLLVLLLPLLDVCAIGLRVPFMYWAAHNGCIMAAKARSYQTSVNGNPPAVQLAQQGVDRVLQSFGGIHANPATTQIMITNISTRATSLVPGPLSTDADASLFTYQMQVTVSASIDPLIVCPFPVSVPGLTGPINLTFLDRQFVENPCGLSI